jgi:hypothetical protein
MNIKEFTKPVTAKKLNESLAARFGQRIDLERFTTEQLQDARNKLRTTLSQVQTTESYDSVQKEEYQKNKLFLDVLNAEISERGDSIADDIDQAVKTVREGKEDEAELVMAAKDMVDRITGWMEDTAEMQTESMLELADAIRDELGQQKAEEFTGSIKPALEQLYQTMESTRETLTSGVGMLTGEAEPMEPMGADDEMGDIDSMEPTDDMDLEGGDDLEAGDDLDDFEADAAAAGGDEEAGREKRESATPKGKRIKEGAFKNAMMADAEKMTKAAFIKKYGEENAETWTTVNESSKKK